MCYYIFGAIFMRNGVSAAEKGRANFRKVRLRRQIQMKGSGVPVMARVREYEEERRTKRERIRRKKKRKLKRKIQNFCRLAVMALLLFAAVRLLISCLRFTKILPETDSYRLEAPMIRTENEVKDRLEELAKQNRGFKDILKNIEDYPETYLAALVNNPEMLEYVKGYPEYIGTASGGLTKEEKSEKYPLFLQWDSRWGYASYGGSSIGISGCGPSCLAMVSYALTKDESITPLKTAQYSESQGYYIEGTGTSWELMTSGASAFGITGSELPLSEERMKQELDAGHPIICAMGAGDFTAAGHFIVLYGYDRKGFFVNDPNCKARSEKKWSYEELKGQIKNLWSYQ